MIEHNGAPIELIEFEIIKITHRRSPPPGLKIDLNIIFLLKINEIKCNYYRINRNGRRRILHECLLHPDIEKVLVVNRHPCQVSNPKLSELIQNDFFNLTSIENQLVGYDVCFYCLGFYIC